MNVTYADLWALIRIWQQHGPRSAAADQVLDWLGGELVRARDAQVAAAKAAAADSDWLVVRALQGVPLYWTGRCAVDSIDAFSRHSADARRFARKVDAERVIETLALCRWQYTWPSPVQPGAAP